MIESNLGILHRSVIEIDLVVHDLGGNYQAFSEAPFAK
jgi:hypothetical protein